MIEKSIQEITLKDISFDDKSMTFDITLTLDRLEELFKTSLKNEIIKQIFIMFVLSYPEEAQAFKEKEAKLVEETFSGKELGEIWPMAEDEVRDSSGLQASERHSTDSEDVEYDLPDSSFIPEETSSEDGEKSESSSMGGGKYNVTYTRWEGTFRI